MCSSFFVARDQGTRMTVSFLVQKKGRGERPCDQEIVAATTRTRSRSDRPRRPCRRSWQKREARHSPSWSIRQPLLGKLARLMSLWETGILRVSRPSPASTRSYATMACARQEPFARFHEVYPVVGQGEESEGRASVTPRSTRTSRWSSSYFRGTWIQTSEGSASRRLWSEKFGGTDECLGCTTAFTRRDRCRSSRAY